MTFALRTASGDSVTVDAARLSDAHSGFEFTVDLGAGQLLPGLINAHDHLYLNHYPRVGSPPYTNTYEWAQEVHGRFTREIARASALPREDALLFGALKNLLGGVTTVVHHDPWDDLFYNEFPLRVARVRVAHSFPFEQNLPEAIAGDRFTRDRPLTMHLAEGIDRDSADEVQRAEREGFVNERLIAVHLVGIDREGIELMRAANAAIAWCPSSNKFLFGTTAPRELFASGIDVLIGTDSLLSAAGTLLDELREARQTGFLSDRRLIDAVGPVAARRLDLPPPILAPGGVADLIFVRRPVLEARPCDVGLVMVGGKPKLGDADFAELFDRCEVAAEPLLVGGVSKVVAAPLATVAARVFELTPECGRILG